MVTLAAALFVFAAFPFVPGLSVSRLRASIALLAFVAHGSVPVCQIVMDTCEMGPSSSPGKQQAFGGRLDFFCERCNDTSSRSAIFEFVPVWQFGFFRRRISLACRSSRSGNGSKQDDGRCFEPQASDSEAQEAEKLHGGLRSKPPGRVFVALLCDLRGGPPPAKAGGPREGSPYGAQIRCSVFVWCGTLSPRTNHLLLAGSPQELFRWLPAFRWLAAAVRRIASHTAGCQG
jgi:hypothetical protein